MSDPMEALRRRYPTAVTFRFGDTADLSRELVDLVRSGKKTATCGALRDYENGEAMPSVGRRDIVLAWDGTPELVIETLELIACRFIDVTEEMAMAEGEDDSLDGWRDGHRRYFARNGGFFPEMQVVWERFAVVEDLNPSG